jgi:hypothetical protein
MIEKKRLFGRPRPEWEDNIKIEEIVCESVD